MAGPILLKIRYYDPNSNKESGNVGAKNAAHINYIATRPGAECGELEIGDKDFAAELGENSKYVQYMDERPRSHGLFSQENEKEDLDLIKSELRTHEGIVWRMIISLKEEDAVKFGYTNKKVWENALRSCFPEAAKAMGIRESNLRWVAAFHAEMGHPHVHLVCWEKSPERPVGLLGKGETKEIKRILLKEIYAEERTRLLTEKTAMRDLLRSMAKDSISKEIEIIKDINESRLHVEALDGKEPGIAPKLWDSKQIEIADKIFKLSQVMPGKGRTALAYMSKEVKELARETADLILNTSHFKERLEQYLQSSRDIASHYSSQDKEIKEAEQKAFDDLRDRVSQVVLSNAKDLQQYISSSEGFNYEAINEQLLQVGRQDAFIERREDGIDIDSKESFSDIDNFINEKPVIITEIISEESSDLIQRLHRSVFNYFEREVIKYDNSYMNIEDLEVTNSLVNEIRGDLQSLIGDIDKLGIRPSMVFLNEDIQKLVYSYSEKVLNDSNIKFLHDKLLESNADLEKLHLRVSNIYLKYASELIPRELPDIKMILHKERACNALEKMQSATGKYIQGRIEDQEFAIKTMYKSYLYLGYSPAEARESTINWSQREGLFDIDKHIVSVQKSIEYIAEKYPENEREFIGTKQWDRFRDCLGYEEEEFLKPWIGVINIAEIEQEDQKKEETPTFLNDIKVNVISERVLPIVESFRNAVNNGLPKEEVAWTLKGINNVLYSFSIDDEQRVEIVRNFFEKSNIQIPEQQYRDLFDKTDISGNRNYWMGYEKWNRLTTNLNIQEEKPWVTDDLIYRLHKSIFKYLEREILKVDAGFSKTEMKAFEESVYNTIKENMNEIASDISDLKVRASMVFLGDELQEKVKNFTNVVFQGDNDIDTMSKYISNMPNSDINKINTKIADIYLKHASELIERDNLQIEMKLHEERVINAIEKMKQAPSTYLDSKKEDQEFTIKTMYKSFLFLGHTEQEATHNTIEWGNKAGIEESEKYTLEVKEWLEKIKEKYPDDDRNFIGTKDWDRFRDSLGYEEEEFLKPWIGVIKETESQNDIKDAGLPKDIKIELIEENVSPVIETIKNAANLTLPKDEIAWTLKSINNVLHSLNIDDRERKSIVRGFFDKSNINIPEQQYRDLFDKTDISGNKNFWMGHEKWKRFTSNLNITVDKPWKMDDLVYRLHKSVFSQLERELSKDNTQIHKFEMSQLGVNTCAEIRSNMAEIALKVNELKIRPSMVFLDKELQNQVNSFSKTLLNNDVLSDMLSKLSTQESVNMDKLYTKLSDIYLKYASELIERDKLEIQMVLHDERAINAIEKMKEATSQYIDGRPDEQEFTVKTMYKAYLFLGYSEKEATDKTMEWSNKVGIENTESYISKEKDRIAALNEKNPDEKINFIGTKEWDRFRDNLGYEEEEFLKPWIGLVDKNNLPTKVINEQKKSFENIKVELIQEKVYPVIDSFSQAFNTMLPKNEVVWTLKTLNNVLYAMNLDDQKREDMVRGFFERSKINIPEHQYKDMFDKTILSGNKDYWLGSEKWERLINNLKVEVESPWKFLGERNMSILFAKDIWKSSWRLLEKEKTKAQAKANIENMKIIYQQQQKNRGIQLDIDYDEKR